MTEKISCYNFVKILHNFFSFLKHSNSKNIAYISTRMCLTVDRKLCTVSGLYIAVHITTHYRRNQSERLFEVMDGHVGQTRGNINQIATADNYCNRKSHVVYRMLLLQTTLSDLHGHCHFLLLQNISNAISRAAVTALNANGRQFV